MRPAPFYGWVVVGAAFSVLSMAYGASFSFGVFFSAMLEEFGWSRAALSGAAFKLSSHASSQTAQPRRSEEHTSELQSPIDISYAVFCWKKKKI